MYMGSILFVQNIIVAWSKHEIYGGIFAIKIYELGIAGAAFEAGHFYGSFQTS